jgi:hypothetical protein
MFFSVRVAMISFSRARHKMSLGISAAATSLRAICRLFASDVRQVIWPAGPGWYWARRHRPGSGYEIVCVHEDSTGKLRVSRIGEHQCSPPEAWDWHYRVKPPANH